MTHNELAARIERAEGLIEAVSGEHGWRRREMQAIGAAISTRSSDARVHWLSEAGAR